ncbi:MAG TPA: nucleoside monophosphate kinase, partial [Ramlibacter sp.]|nr:nucleoside monophosphate kinase [Ramlibacter sp.]
MDAVPLASPMTLGALSVGGDVVRRRGTPVNVVLVGPPGAGKGTQAGTVADLVGITHVASGDLFREAVKLGTEFGRLAQSYMDRGELVPDDLTVGMVMARLQEPDCLNGFVLDGFPRTVNQARALDEKLGREGRQIAKVINLSVPEDVLLARLSGRWLCKSCHTSYHTLFSPPAQAGVCDRCGGQLYQRIDDKEETARHRLGVYFGE